MIGNYRAMRRMLWERLIVRGFRTGLIAAMLVVFVCGAVFASLKWSKAFKDLYKPTPDSAIVKAKCAVCHIDPKGKGKLNLYGAMLKGKKVDAKSLKAIESKDADKDKISNIAEIKAGTLPGDPKSKPGKK
jgi:hypothetical protein